MNHTAQLIKKDGKLIYRSSVNERAYKAFLDSIEEGQIVEAVFSFGDNGLLSQLARINKCIREIAKEVGEGHEQVKQEIKKKAGFCIKGECKSMADMTKEELDSMFDQVCEVGLFLNMSFR